ncbi:AbrB/MazE/SpoVT family DNA-binding domain-containing protein [Anaerobaca lacustris]|jgi:antitoxin MazE|uniref:SpoVT-AbrB domain-containing protein n=1 Tax=Anaerobaca lacustris TaxID=3044600 RepID=A0AAW6U5I5_9BACT|nr:hypothetical protein [Sedimentisphaerales bacterium M17dextr]
MVAKVQKWGNSQGLRLSRQLLEDAKIAVGDPVDVAVHDGVIVVAPLKRRRGKHSLRDLVGRIPEGHEAQELGWGGPAGREVW